LSVAIEKGKFRRVPHML